MERQYKVRFHLAQGVNFMKWQVRDSEGNVNFYDPNTTSLRLRNCKLVNRPSTAKKIHDGANKEVCAWISCESVEVNRKSNAEGMRLSYNPKVTPNWVMGGENVDGQEIDFIITKERSLYSV